MASARPVLGISRFNVQNLATHLKRKHESCRKIMGDKEEKIEKHQEKHVHTQVTNKRNNKYVLEKFSHFFFVLFLFLHYLGQGERLSRKQRSIFDMLCFPASLLFLLNLPTSIWIFMKDLCSCGHREWREISLRSPLTNRASKTNLERKNTNK